jgi:hypothetical protein
MAADIREGQKRLDFTVTREDAARLTDESKGKGKKVN